MASVRAVNGVLAVPASVTSKKAANTTSSTASNVSPRPGTQRLRLIVRRLPPGLTQAEFRTILGEEWQLGSGKVDWFAYKDGKISKE
jgi:regulator of nonsense transcripts 3